MGSIRRRQNYPPFRMRVYGLLLFAFLILCAACFPTDLFAAKIVRVGFYENSPKIFTAESGLPAGIFADIIGYIAEKEGWELRFVHGTWSQGLDRLDKGDIDLMPDVAYTESRGKLFSFHSDPALYSWFQVFSRRGSGIRSIPDLDGKRVAVLYRSIQQEIFDRIVRDFGLSVSFVTFSDFESAFQAVADGKTDAVITNRFFGAQHMRAYNLEDTAISFNPTRLFFAAPQDFDPAILAAIDKHLREMKKNPDSVYFRSLAQWPAGEVFMVVPSWLKTTAALFALLSILGGFLSFSFKRQADSRAAELTRLFDNAPLGLFFSGRDGTIKRANAEALRMLGLEEREVVNRAVGEFILRNRKREEQPDSNPNRQEISEAFQAEGRRKNGALFPLACIVFPLPPSTKLLGSYMVFQDISLQAANEKRIGSIIRELNRTVATLKKSWEQTVRVLAAITEVRDPYTSGHQRRVARLAAAIAGELGMDKKKVRQVELAAMIHDIGKIEIPSEILSKPGRLSDIEYRLIQTHPAAGHRILQTIEVPWALAEIIHQHHERMDGSGYPRGLPGSEILMEARIIAVADTVEAMSSHRPYRAGKGIDAALGEVTSQRGRGFDRDVVDACLRLFREKEFRFDEEPGGIG
jgi:PAS domain S-box-containing protein/putative nucleotidyltransferase with HDIG domain